MRPFFGFRYSHLLQLILWCSLAMAVVCNSGCRVAGLSQNTAGVQLYQQGRFAEALQQFQVAQQTDPNNADTYYNLASTYHQLGVGQNDQRLIEQAEGLYHQCLDIQPNHVDCHRGLAVLLAQTKRPDSAVRFLTNWATQNPAMSDPKVELARLQQELGETKLAERFLDEALALNPHDSRAWTARAQLRESAGDLNQALQNYQQSLAINNFQPDVYQRMASLQYKIAQNNATGTPSGGWTVQNNTQSNNR
ncbi:MAG: tetratricopeptide repeat protein [Planctomycetales bacterium]|nr:tetratricopeptide repeat protein [Planctomycetales bacterium]